MNKGPRILKALYIITLLQTPLAPRNLVKPLQSKTKHTIRASGGVGDVHGALHDVVVAVALLVLVPELLFLKVLHKLCALVGAQH